MYVTTLSQQILRDMWSQKFRSLFALFGIAWGTITVILLLALGHGFTVTNERDMMSIVDGTLFVVPGTTSISHQGLPKGQPVHIKTDTVINLKHVIPDIKMLSPTLINNNRIMHQNKLSRKDIYGVDSSFVFLRKINLTKESRFLNPIDIQTKARVIVLGDHVKEKLFGHSNPIGKTVTIKQVPFTVIGVTDKPKRHVYSWYKNAVLIPYSTYISIFGDENVRFFSLFPNPKVDTKLVENSVRSYFAHHENFAKSDETAIRIFDTTKIFQYMRWFFLGIELFLGACGTLTLAIGSLGVANIMFLIVSERTREIGIRLSVGAKYWHIMAQILLESLIIVGLGGLVGFITAFAVIVLMRHITLPHWLGEPMLSWVATVVTILILAILGMLAGYFPAKKAATMDPVEALGH